MIAAGFYGSSEPAAEADDLASADVRSAPTVGRSASAAEGLGLAAGLIGAAALGGFTILKSRSSQAVANAGAAQIVARPDSIT